MTDAGRKTKTVVVGIDGSQRAAAVLSAGLAMAERLEAQMVLVSAVEGLEYMAMMPPEVPTWNDPTLWQKIEDETRRLVTDAARTLPKGRLRAERVVRGQAWRVICEAAQAEHAELIVVGAHGYRPLERLLGTTAARVANRAETSVLVVRGAVPPVGFARLLVAHDGSPRAAGVLARAAQLAEPSSALCLVRAVSVPPVGGKGSLALVGIQDLEQRLTGAADQALREAARSLPVVASCEARIGAPADVVVDVAKEKDATLVLIGSHGYDAVDRVLGTVAGQIVNRIDRSVLIVR